MRKERKIILIGSEEYDHSTDLVCRWLKSFGEIFIRLNVEDSFILKYIDIDNEGIDILFSINEKCSLWLSEIKSFWYRRGGISLKNNWKISPKPGLQQRKNKTIREFEQNIYGEYLTLDDFVSYIMEFNKDILVVGNPTSVVNNKLIHLLKAKEAGFQIPRSHVITEKTDLIELLDSSHQYVIKPMRDVFSFSIVEKQKYTLAQLYTNDLDRSYLENSEETFFPSLVQEKIEKKIELRIFVVENNHFAMAIFSQNDSKTDLDFRRYNSEKPNRYVPFTLPANIIEKTCVQGISATLPSNRKNTSFAVA